MKRKIVEHLKDFLFICFVLFIAFGKLPYNVEMPGGIINLTERVKIDGQKIPLKGSFNMAYVSVVQGSIPYILYGLISNDVDVVKTQDSLLENETVEEANRRNKLFLEQSKNAAVLAALKEAEIEYEIKNRKTNVLYIYKDAKTTLEVGDNIIECNDNKVDSIQDIVKAIDSKKIGDTISFKVVRFGKVKKATAKIIDVKGQKKINVVSLTTFDIDSLRSVELDSFATESGSSGGLMMSLMVYSGLTNSDYTLGKKVAGTGTIDENGKVGEISGIKYKIIGAVRNKVDIFFVPSDNYKEALQVKKEKDYDLKIVKVDSIREAINYLEGVRNEK